MRVIAGKYRGKKLQEFDLSSTKPTTDRVKESIFNLIQFDVVDAVVLDLFGGVGALGIEAISRGAKKTFFVDCNEQAIKLIKNNLIGIDGEYEVFHMDYISFLISTKQSFDIILLDPPYKTDYGIIAIETILKNNLLNQNGIIIFETCEDKQLKFNYPNLNIKRKKYGSVAVYKMEKIE